MFSEDADGFDHEHYLFLVSGEVDDDTFRIHAETEFVNLGVENFKALEFFIEEANSELEKMGLVYE